MLDMFLHISLKFPQKFAFYSRFFNQNYQIFIKIVFFWTTDFRNYADLTKTMKHEKKWHRR